VIGYHNARRWAELIERVIDPEAETVPPGFLLELDPPEMRFLKRVKLWSTGDVFVAAGAAGNFSRMQLANPVAPANRTASIVVVKGIGIINKIAIGAISIRGDSAATGGAISPVNCLDPRQPIDATNVPGVRPPDQTIQNNNNQLGGYPLDRAQVAAGADGYGRIQQDWRDGGGVGFIITPGHNLTIYDLTAAEAATFIAWGYTRPAEAEEFD